MSTPKSQGQIVFAEALSCGLPAARPRGFTLIEMLVTLALLAALASSVVPLAQVAVTRQREAELRLSLREIRQAIDAYRLAVQDGRIVVRMGSNGYPTTLNALADQVLGAQAGSDNVPVIISADKQVRYESVVKVMDTLQRRGVQHVGLSVRQGG